LFLEIFGTNFPKKVEKMQISYIIRMDSLLINSMGQIMVDFGSGQGRSNFETGGVAALRR
jgi:hypothetical protein